MSRSSVSKSVDYAVVLVINATLLSKINSLAACASSNNKTLISTQRPQYSQYF